ncbi:MAG: CBS domain-containing protein [Candidatus Hodarchaeota archaeon]
MPILPDLKEIKTIRRKLNLTQEDLHRKLKIPQATISRIENGIGNPSYLAVKVIFDFLEHERLRRKKLELKAENVMTRNIISINSKASIKDAVILMNKHNVSQIPILEGGKNLGSITSKKIQKSIIDRSELINAEVDLIKELPFPEIEEDWEIKDVSNLLTNYSAVLVKKNNKYIGIIADADLLQIS